MSSRKYESMIHLLISRTERGEVNWQPTSNKFEFIVYIDNFSIAIGDTSYLDETTENVYPSRRIVLRDSTGNELDSVYYQPGEDLWPGVQNLYQNARRKALNIERAVDLILLELSKKGGVGSPAVPKVQSDDGPTKAEDIPF